MKKKIVLHINPNDITVSNELHFEVQKRTRAHIFKNKKKYTRKRKHKEEY